MSDLFFKYIAVLCLILLAVTGVKAQQLKLLSEQDFKQCGGDVEFMLGIKNGCDPTKFEAGSYYIDWGDGTPPEQNVNFTGELYHTYNALGAYTLKFSAKPKGGGSLLPPVSYTVVNDRAQPTAGLKVSGGGVKCVGSEVEFEVNGYTENLDHTKYTIDFGDGTAKIYSNLEIKNVSGVIKHIYNKSHCQLGQINGITIKITAVNGCTPRSATIENTYIVVPTKVGFSLPARECTGNQILPQNTSTPDADAACQKPTYTWKVDGKKVSSLPLVFDDPGNYRVTLLGSKGNECSKDSITKEIRIVRRVKALAEPVFSEICENGSVSLKGSGSEGDENTYRWSVVSGGSSNVQFSPLATNADPVAKFTKFGTYRLLLTVDNGCSRDTMSVMVKVKKDPAITKFVALTPMCPPIGSHSGVLTLGTDIVDYLWYNNNTVAPTWTILPASGWEWVGGNGSRKEHPQIKFTVPGEYTLTVKIPSAGCGAGAGQLEKSQKITVYDPVINTAISVKDNKSDVCEQEEIEFVNTTAAQQTVVYSWSVRKGGGEAVLGTDYIFSSGNAVSAAPRLKFLRHGDYEVTAELRVQCNSDTRKFSFHVKKDPEITRFDVLTSICPQVSGHTGILDLSGKIAYLWYNNTAHKPSWTISPADGWTWVTASDVEFPRVKFTKAGVYTLTARLVSAGCGGGALEKSQTIEVYDPVITKDIGIKGGVSSVCENENIIIENRTIAINPVYNWTVIREGGGSAADYSISPLASAAAPSITFRRYGTYTVRVSINAQCAQETQEFKVTVRKNPEITRFDELAPVCNPNVLWLSGQVAYEWYNNENHVPTWSVSGPADGEWKFIAAGDEHAEFPRIKFSKPGIYTLTVKLDGVSCGESSITRSRTIEVLDPTVSKDIKVKGNSIICENDLVVFENNTVSSIPITYLWTVTRKDGSDATGKYSLAGNASDKSQSIKFTGYGEYVVTVSLSTACNVGNPTKENFPVTVLRDPEVYLKELPAACPADKLVLDASKVEYRWNANAPRVLWEVKNADGTPAADVTFVSDAVYPEMKFQRPGRYDISLKLLSIVGCEGKFTEAQKSVIIRDSSMTLAVSPDAHSLCEGNSYTFTNNSTAAEPETYLWTVSPVGDTPADGWAWDGGSRATDKAPRILFRHYGDYTVKVVMTAQGGCNVKEKTMTVDVRKDPRVTLRDYPAMCPGTLSLASAADFDWRKNPPAVKWTITPPAGVAPLPDDLSVLYPTVNFVHPGDYTIVAELTGTGCPDNVIRDQKTLRVFPPDIRVQVNIPVQAEEGKTIRVVNNSIGEIVSYNWTIEGPAGGASFVSPSGASEKEPEILFSKFGDYRIGLTIHGTCTDSVKYYPVTVRGIPSYRFKKFSNICAGTTLRMSDYLDYDSKGATITARWTITPSGGGEHDYVNAGGGNDLLPEIRFNKNGSYTMVLEADAEFGGRQTFTNQINVLQTAVSALTLADQRACTKPGALWALLLENRSAGDSLNYTWNITPADGWAWGSGENNKTPQPTMTITRPGDYVVTLTARNICAESVAEFRVHAYTNPVIDPIENIKDVCERGFVFNGKELVKVHENGDPLSLVRWTITPSGFAFGASENASTLQPSVTFAGSDVPYQMKLEVQNGCNDVISETLTVLVDQFKDIEPLQDKSICALTPPLLLTATPRGGQWLTRGGGMVEKKDDGEYYFNPHRDETETFDVVYIYGHKSCQDQDSFRLTVHKLPVVNAGPDQERCVNLPPLVLGDRNPVGGTWAEKNGVAAGQFDPATVGEGQYTLEYWYTDPLTGCPNLDTLEMTVHPLPDPGFTTSLLHCRDIDSLFTPVRLGVGNRFSWDFGDGTTATSEDAPIRHHYINPGAYQVTLTATSVHTCVAHSAPFPLDVVNQPPAAEFTADKTEGCGPLDVKFTVDPSKYADPTARLSYSWVFGNGETSADLQPVPDVRTFLPPVYDTTYQITFRVYNICDSKVVTKNIRVLSSPEARFLMMPEEGCDPLDVEFANLSTGNGNHYSWTFGDGQTSTDKEPQHTFRAGKKAKPYYIEMEARNNCATTYFRDTINVKPNSLSVKFRKSDKYICAGDTICFTNFSSDTASTILNQVWDFGDGQYSTAWDTCHRFDVPGRLEVSVMLDNGCSKAGYTDTVVVYPIPRLSIASNDPRCEDDTFRLDLVSDQPLKNISWTLGDGATRKDIQGLDHIYENPGNYDVHVAVKSAEIASCPSETTRRIEVWPKPDVRISPLDTVVCPPFLYRPSLSRNDYYFRWDYGDGKPLTSEMEHLYENDTNHIIDHRIAAYVETNRGCRDEYHGRIRVYNKPTAALDKDVSYGRPERVRFINLSKDYTFATWYLPDGRIVNSSDDQELVFNEEDVYPVELVVMNEYGCRDSLHWDYRSYMGGLYFPNTFIPHSNNERVSHFNGIGVGLKEYHLEIFDLYGNKVWETKTLSLGVPSEGWNGRNSQGKELPQGVYIWRAKAVFFSEDVWTGKNNRSGNPQTTQGTVLLLRE